MPKFILHTSAMGVDHWTEKGKIALNESTSQDELAYLHSIGYAGVIKVEKDLDKPKK